MRAPKAPPFCLSLWIDWAYERETTKTVSNDTVVKLPKLIAWSDSFRARGEGDRRARILGCDSGHIPDRFFIRNAVVFLSQRISSRGEEELVAPLENLDEE